METKIKITKTSSEIINYLNEVKKEAKEETKKYIKSKKFQEDLKKVRDLKNMRQ